jgi:hypothetical protein
LLAVFGAVAGLPAPLRELVEVIVVDNFLQLPQHMRGVTVENEAGKADSVWIDLYPGARLMRPQSTLLCRHSSVGVLLPFASTVKA